MLTYYTGPVTTAEMPIPIRGIARTVRASLVTAVSGTAGIPDFEFGGGRRCYGCGGQEG